MEIRFRAATVEDIPAIREVIAESVRGLQVEYTVAQREAAIASVFTVDTRLIADGTYLVALAADGKTVGCGGWSRRATLYGGDGQKEQIDPALLDPMRDAARIRAIFVHPEFARQGIGSMILERSEEAAAREGFRRVEMGSTLSGLSLYRLKGYRELERIRVPVDSDAFIEVVRMTKDLAAYQIHLSRDRRER